MLSPKHFPRLLLPLMAIICSLPMMVQASDDAREKRFAEEISAQWVVGDVVQIPNAGFSAFLGLPAESNQKTKPIIVLAHGVGTQSEDK